MIKPIKSETDYENALILADHFFSNPPIKGSNEGDQFEILLLVIKDYEDKNYQIQPLDAIDTIKLVMEEKGLFAKDLEPYIGKKSYISQILNRKKPLTLEIAKNLYIGLNIPAQILLSR